MKRRLGPRATSLGSALAMAIPMVLASMPATPQVQPKHADAPRLILTRSSVVSVFASIAERVDVEAFRRAGIPVEVRQMPLLRAIETAASGEADADIARTIDVSQRYPSMMTVDTPVIRAEIAAYSLDKDFASRSRAEIRSMRACIPRGSVVVEHSVGGMQVEFATPREVAFDMLVGGRCQVVIMLLIEGSTILRDKPIPGMVRWPYLWGAEPLYLALNRKHATLVPALNRALLDMQKEGVIDRYYAEALKANNVEPLKLEPKAVSR